MPHSDKRFVGYEAEDKKMDSEVLRKYIFGGHVAEYMSELQEEDPEKYQAHFSSFIAAELEADDLEDMYKEVRAALLSLPSSVWQQMPCARYGLAGACTPFLVLPAASAAGCARAWSRYLPCN